MENVSQQRHYKWLNDVFSCHLAFCQRAVESQTLFMARAFWQIFVTFSRLLCHFPRLHLSGCIKAQRSKVRRIFSARISFSRSPKCLFWFRCEPKFIAAWENIKIRLWEEISASLVSGINQIINFAFSLFVEAAKVKINWWMMCEGNKSEDKQDTKWKNNKTKV